MKLVAAAVVRNEADRYLEPWLDHLLDFCDRVVLLDDSSEDDTFEFCASWSSRVDVYQPWPGQPRFDTHEGKVRQALLDLVMRVLPERATHVLAIDADEFISDGTMLRNLVETQQRSAQAWALPMREIWELDGDGMCQRDDGGWRPHKVPVLWQAPSSAEYEQDTQWRIEDKALACGRVPMAIRATRPLFVNDPSVLHFGWTNEAARQARYDRYMRIDGGRFHAGSHLASIMYPCDQIQLSPLPWPRGLARYRKAITQVVYPDVDVSRGRDHTEQHARGAHS